MLGSNYFYYVQDPWGSWAEYSFDIDFVPADVDWPAADHPPEDSFYIWGPTVPDDFIINHEQPRSVGAVAFLIEVIRCVSLHSNETAASPRLGLRVDQELVDLTALGLPSTLKELLQQGADGARGRDARGDAREDSDAVVQCFVPAPGDRSCEGNCRRISTMSITPRNRRTRTRRNIRCCSIAFRNHGSPTAVPLVRPHVSEQFDYEGEMVVVIGKAGRYIAKERALDHVAGYSLFNDGSIRDYQFKSTQWMMGKNFDATGPSVPNWSRPTSSPPGAAGLQLRTRLNGQVLQNANTRDMIFDVADARACLLGSHDAVARRHHHQRHAIGCGLCAEAAGLDEGRRRLRSRRRRHRGVTQQRRRRTR